MQEQSPLVGLEKSKGQQGKREAAASRVKGLHTELLR